MTELPEVLKRFFADFDKHLGKCLETGDPYRLTLFADGRNVTVDIYEEKGTMKKFNQSILGAVKAQSGIDISTGSQPAEKK